jgi:hypothetical protein
MQRGRPLTHNYKESPLALFFSAMISAKGLILKVVEFLTKN